MRALYDLLETNHLVSFDIDLPVECDDEFWEGEPSFQQPKDRPSKLSFACHMLRLYQILGVVLRSIVSLAHIRVDSSAKFHVAVLHQQVKT